MQLEIRKENPEDWNQLKEVVRQAFMHMEHSDQTEHELVGKLRVSECFIPELSLVALSEGAIVGHILLTELKLHPNPRNLKLLALAPVSVLPEYQKKGIGSALILKAHELAKAMFYSSIILIGHPEYYTRFGYVNINPEWIKLPFDVPTEYTFIHLLDDNPLESIKGEVRYDKAFFD